MAVGYSRLPGSYSWRRATPADLSVVGRLLEACDIDELGHTDFLDTAWLAEEWDNARLDLSRDSWLITTASGRAAAYAHQLEEGDAVDVIGWVHPEQRGCGLGRWLVDAAEERARRGMPPKAKLLQTVAGSDQSARRLLSSAGYVPVRSFWHMEAALVPGRPRFSASGTVIDEFVAGRDEVVAHEVLEAAFAQHWEFFPTPFELWRSENVAKDWFDPSLSFLARCNGEVAGVLIGRVLGDHGYVADLGVLESWRGRGIGAALLTRSFDAFAGRGLDRVRLNVDSANESGAVRLYQRMGMARVRSWDVFEKPL